MVLDTPTREIAGTRNGLTIEKIEQIVNSSPLKKVTSPMKKDSDEDNGKVIEGLDFDFSHVDKNADKSHMLQVIGRKNVTIRRCIFHNKPNEGLALIVKGSGTENVTVEDCIFENLNYHKKDKGEAMRIGESTDSGLVLGVIVRRCIFRNNSGDPEVVSVKAVGNTVEDCFFIDNEANLTVRHGGLTKIHHNHFKGTNGVRIHGYRNYVNYNCFENNTATNEENKERSPITLRWGKVDKDPNWDAFNKPSNKVGSPHSEYAETVDTIVEGNEFKNCNNTITEVKKGDGVDKPPKNTTDVNNKKVEKFTYEA
jgi:hypothetical protein